MAQLLFTGIWCRKASHITIAFLTTLVQNPDEDDWDKLWGLLAYLKQTIKLPLILRTYGVNVFKWWVDASYAAHYNIRVHTRRTI